MIDLYCERVEPGIWSEPLNALSNISFLIAAWFVWLLSKQKSRADGSIKLLVVLIISIGVGSFTFHTLATRWSLMLDLVPIMLFQLTFFWLYSQKIMTFKAAHSILLLSVFLLAIMLGKISPQFINGSLLYLPTLLLFTAMGAFHYLRNKTERWLLLAASTLFLLSFMLRTLDQRLCSQFPIGTHFLWHICSATVVYLITRALIVNMNETEKI